MKSSQSPVAKDAERAVFGVNGPLMLNTMRTVVGALELEDVLLHFSHAKRVDKSQRAMSPDYVPAKLPSAYTKPLEDFPPGGFYDWYQELCELTHPASDSVCYMLVPDTAGRLEFQASIDCERIEAHLEKNQARLAEVLRISQVPALVILRVLLYVGPPELHVSAVKGIDLRQIGLWRKCAAALEVEP